jgi:hypothetical protein
VIRSRRMRLAGDIARAGVMRSTLNISVARPEVKITLGRRKWEDNIKMGPVFLSVAADCKRYMRA